MSEPSGSESEAAPATTVASTPGLLQVHYGLSKASTCCLCNSKSTDLSPIELEAEEDRMLQGRLPWGKYRKVLTTEGDTMRVPEGRVCLVCLNVFRALGQVLTVYSDSSLVW